MSQERIWDYFQNEGVDSFGDALPRYEYLAQGIVASSPSGASVLNIGTGSGVLELALRHAGFSVSALDPSEAAIARLRDHGVDGRVGFAESLPFKDAVFDAVVASEVLEHLDPRQCELALAQIRRVLKPGGLFIGTVPFNERLSDSRTVCPNCGHLFHRWGHQQAFVRETLAKLLGGHFAAVAISTRSFVVWRGGVRRLAKSAVKWLLGRMGEPISSPHLCFECRAPVR